MRAVWLLLAAPLAAGDFRYNPAAARVEILSGGSAVLASPAEGLWSVACDWRDGWPADWRHARPSSSRVEGDWTVLRAEAEACGAQWTFEDAYRPARGAVRVLRRFTWKGLAPGVKATLSVRFQAPGARAVPLLPGILYSGNPSGAASGKVPVYTGRAGEQAIYEEHRYPMPFAFVELGGKGAALHSVPSPTPFGNLRDQWWSLGLEALAGSTELLLLSGPCASNGKRSVIKALQSGFMPYDQAWLKLPAEGVVEKEFYLEAFSVEREGAGLARPVATSLKIFAPEATGDMPGFAEIVRDKYRMAQSRWREQGAEAGFKKYPDRPFYVMGWCGQAEAPGFALLVLGGRVGDPKALSMATRSLDFLSGAQFFEDGFHTWYDFEKKAWSRVERVSEGQAMFSFANAIRAGRAKKLDTRKWEAFLRHACQVHAARILADGWRPKSTAED